jgi:hypothetical protein
MSQDGASRTRRATNSRPMFAHGWGNQIGRFILAGSTAGRWLQPSFFSITAWVISRTRPPTQRFAGAVSTRRCFIADCKTPKRQASTSYAAGRIFFQPATATWSELGCGFCSCGRYGLRLLKAAQVFQGIASQAPCPSPPETRTHDKAARPDASLNARPGRNHVRERPFCRQENPSQRRDGGSARRWPSGCSNSALRSAATQPQPVRHALAAHQVENVASTLLRNAARRSSRV